MQVFCVFAVLIFISNCDKVYSGSNVSAEKVEERSVASELANLLNGTYFNLNENVCQLQRRVDAIEQAVDSDHQCECNEAESNEFKQEVSDALYEFSKILSGFENQLRILQNEQEELRELLDKKEVASSTATTPNTTTTSAPEVCDQGWISSPEKCYYVSTTSKKTDWSTAVSRCTAMGAKLVEIQTDEEASFIMGNLPNRVGTYDIIYTGRKRNDRDEWVFISNDKPVDTSVRTWDDGEPDGGSQRCGCTRQFEDFLMQDCYCTGYNLFYICEIEPSSTVITTDSLTTATTNYVTTLIPKVCDQGWISSPTKCYYVSTDSEKTEWSTSISRCTTIGAKLVEIETDEEASFIMENLPSHVRSYELIYTGRKRNYIEEWVFVSNNKMVDTSVRTWSGGIPDGISQKCGCTRQSDDFLMLACLCTGFDLYYICEIER